MRGSENGECERDKGEKFVNRNRSPADRIDRMRACVCTDRCI